MKPFDIVVQPKGAALSIGGQSEPRYGGHKATARDAAGRLVIPATALRGALRIELERLLRGVDAKQTACSAHDEAEAEGQPSVSTPPTCSCPVCRLFGQGGFATGTLRLEDAVFQGQDRQSKEVVLRPQVAVSRRTGTAAESHLLFQETSPVFEAQGGPTFRARAELVLRGQEDGGEDLEKDLKNLQAACRALRAVGGAKARGLGWVECMVEALPPAPPHPGPTPPGRGAFGRLPEGEGPDLLLTLEALAPLHFGAGPARDFFHPTLDYAPASTVRGALAFALLEQGLATAKEQGFQDLFGEKSPVTFGSARLAGHVPSETRRLCRPKGPDEHVFDDLVALLLRGEAGKHGLALAQVGSPCAVAGCQAEKAANLDRRAGAVEPLRRVRTRTSINRRTGTAMDQRLYSQEVLEPRLAGSNGTALTLKATVRSVPPAGLQLLAKLAGGSLRMGGKRSKGMGLCRVGLAAAPGDAAQGAVQRGTEACQGLTQALQEGWEELARVADGLPSSPLPAGHQALALVLTEPWLTEPWLAAEGKAAAGPLGQQVGEAGGRLLASFLRYTQVGSFTIAEARRWGAEAAGEQPSRRAVAAGAVFVYHLPAAALAKHLPAWVRQGQRGEDALGHGRFQIRGPQDDFPTEGES